MASLQLVSCILLLFSSYCAALGFNDSCVFSWSPWSSCFPGTTSDNQGFQERWFILEPSQVDAPSCPVGNSVLQVETVPCDTYTAPVIVDLANDSLPDCVAIGRHRCANGRCIDLEYTCNGDDDCGDSSDEFPIMSTCAVNPGSYVCGLPAAQGSSAIAPRGERFLMGIPGIEQFGGGFDVLTGEFRSAVLSMAPHGSCRRELIGGETDMYYRIPKNIASFRQIYDVAIGNVKMMDSAVAVLNSTKQAFQYTLDFGGNLLDVSGRTGLTQNTDVINMALSNINGDEEFTYVTQSGFVSTSEATLQSPNLLELSTSFISRVMQLPHHEYSYSRYMSLVRDFGTHYVSESKLGGEYLESNIYSRCWLTSEDYRDYSSRDWKENVVDCTRQFFYFNLDPTTSTVSRDCQYRDSGGITHYLQEEVFQKKINVRGGSISSSSELQFGFSKAAWDAWVLTVPKSPVLNTDNFRLKRISGLINSASIPFDTADRRHNVTTFLDQAIDMYLDSYDAEQLCAPCGFVEEQAVDENGLNVDLYLYGVPYLTGTSSDYKCYCTYGQTPDEVTCGVKMNNALLLLTISSFFIALYNNL